jgi:hypothetical protein
MWMLLPSETTAGYLQSPAMEIKAEAESALFTDREVEAESAARQMPVKSIIKTQISIQVRNLIINLR